MAGQHWLVEPRGPMDPWPLGPRLPLRLLWPLLRLLADPLPHLGEGEERLGAEARGDGRHGDQRR